MPGVRKAAWSLVLMFFPESQLQFPASWQVRSKEGSTCGNIISCGQHGCCNGAATSHGKSLNGAFFCPCSHILLRSGFALSFCCHCCLLLSDFSRLEDVVSSGQAAPSHPSRTLTLADPAAQIPSFPSSQGHPGTLVLRAKGCHRLGRDLVLMG